MSVQQKKKNSNDGSGSFLSVFQQHISYFRQNIQIKKILKSHEICLAFSESQKVKKDLAMAFQEL